MLGQILRILDAAFRTSEHGIGDLCASSLNGRVLATYTRLDALPDNVECLAHDA
jgi:hypothetical protein